MIKRAFIIFAMTAVLLAVSLFGCACAADAGQEPAARTILLWANGARSEDPFSHKIANRLMKMMDAEIPDSVNIIVLTGGIKDGVDPDMPPELADAPKGWTPDLPLEGADSVRLDCNQIWKMKGAHDGQRGALVLLEENGLPGAEKGSLMHPDTLKAFIDYGAANYPAEKYDLILINHGAGPSLGWSMDEVFAREDGMQMMSMPETCRALKESTVERFDFVCFYACLMGSVEDAVMLSPYVDTLIFSEENLPGPGAEFNGMLEMLREDPRTDSFLLGKRIVDDTIGNFSSDDVAKNLIATYSVVDTKNLVKRLVPEMKALSEILYREAAEPDKRGEYCFYDEFRSAGNSIEFGRSTRGYQLYDLGNFVTALGIADAEYDSAADVAELTNAYTDVSVRIMSILNDRDGSGDDVLYSRDTNNVHKATGSFYTRDAEGKLVRNDSGFLKSTGLSIFFDMGLSWLSPYYSSAIDGCLALGDLDEDSARFLKTYRDAELLYTLIQGSGRAVFELEGRQDITAADIMSAWEKLGIASWDNSAIGIPSKGLTDTCEIVKASGFDVDPWLEKIAAQQAAEIMKKETIAVRRRESEQDRGTAGSYRLLSDKLSARQLDNLYMRVKLKADYPYNTSRFADYSGEYVPFGDRYLTGELSADLLMPALFYSENGGDFYRLVYGGSAALEIGLYDGKWYALKDAGDNSAPVQVYTDINNPKHIQVPAAAESGEGDDHYVSKGLLEFFLDGGEEAPAAGFAPKPEHLEITDGSLPLNGEMFTGTRFYAIGALKTGAPAVRLGPAMIPDGSESGGFTLVRLPTAEIREIRDVRVEYYLRDIYGNELDLTDAAAAADQEPLLKNLAFAEAKAENGEVTVTYGGETLNPDLDYMVYTKDGETLIQGVGEYAGSIVLGDGE